MTLGKEWYDDRGSKARDTTGLGIALQGSYANFDGDAEFSYLSLSLQLSMTRF